MTTVLRCAHIIRPVLPTPKPGIIGHPDNLEAFTRMELEHRADPCPAMATMQTADGSPRCKDPSHGGVEILDQQRLLQQLTAVAELGLTAEADAALAVKVVDGDIVSEADFSRCSQSFRTRLVARGLSEARRLGRLVVDNIADLVTAEESIEGLCNDVSPSGHLCFLSAAHPPDPGHASWTPEKVAIRAFVTPFPEETGWVCTRKRDGMWFTFGPGWMTTMLPRPLLSGFERNLRVAVSEPETYLREVVMALHEVLPVGETAPLVELVARVCALRGMHEVPVSATVFALIVRSQLVGTFEATSWSTPASGIVREDLSDAQVELLTHACVVSSGAILKGGGQHASARALAGHGLGRIQHSEVAGKKRSYFHPNDRGRDILAPKEPVR